MERTKPHTNGTLTGQKVGQRIAQLQVLASMVDRIKLARQLGESYEGKRDLYEALGYPVSLTFYDYYSRYKRQDIAKALIDRPVNTTWKGGVTLLESDDDKDTPFEQAWRELDDRIGLTQKLNRLDKLSCLGEYGALLLGFDDVTRDTWNTPVESGERKLLYVKPLGQPNAQIKTWDTDPASPRYGQPNMYNVTLKRPGSESTTKDTKSFIVHHSRILHVSMDLLDNEVEGEPILQAVFNRLMDLEKLVGGSAEMFWRGARPGYQGKIQEDFRLDSEQEDDLMKQLDEYEHNLRRFIVAEGVDIQALTAQISDPTNHVDIQVQMISAMTGIPKRILTGSERGELASSQDQGAWKELIQARREELVEAVIIHPFVQRMVDVRVLPEYNDRYSVVWSDLFAPSEKDKVEVGRNRTQSLKDYASEPAAEMMVPFDLFAQHFLGMSAEQVELMKETREANLDNIISEEEDETEPLEPPPNEEEETEEEDD